MSEFNVTVEGGTSKRLLTKGKYCDRDIVVTAQGGGGISPKELRIDYKDNDALVVPANLFSGVFSYQEHNINPIRSVSFANAWKVEHEAFRACYNLTSVNIPEVTHIEYNAFDSCIALQNISIPNVLIIENSAFEGCSALTKIRLPKCVDVLFGAFNGCESLAEITAANLESLGAYAISGCTSLTNIDFPLITMVTTGAFMGCTALKSINIPAVTTIIADAFFECTSLEIINLPKVTSIGAKAFYGCSKLKAVVLRTTETVCVAELSAFTDTPMLTGQGHIYVPAAMYEYYRAGYEAALDQLMPGFFGILFRKLEDYTVDGTVTGDLDESKI